MPGHPMGVYSIPGTPWRRRPGCPHARARSLFCPAMRREETARVLHFLPAACFRACASTCVAASRDLRTILCPQSSRSATTQNGDESANGSRVATSITHADQAWAFFQDTLSAPKLIVAPMVRQSELAFRMLTRAYGAQLCYTAMMPACSLLHILKELRWFSTCEGDRPLILQLCGNSPECLSAALASSEVQSQVDGVDINLGCPQKCAAFGRFGAFLLQDPMVVTRVVQDAVAAGPLPVCAKMRLLPTLGQTLHVAGVLERAGVSLLALHGRLPSMKHDGAVDVGAIAAVVKALSIPVLANGGVQDRAGCQHLMDQTGAAGVMVANGLLRNPRLFACETPTTGSTESTTDLSNLPTGSTNSTTDLSDLALSCDLAWEYLNYTDKYPPGDPRIVREHLRHLFRLELKERPGYRDLWAFVSHKQLVQPRQFRAYVCAVAVRLGQQGVSFTVSPTLSLKQIKHLDPGSRSNREKRKASRRR